MDGAALLSARKLYVICRINPFVHPFLCWSGNLYDSLLTRFQFVDKSKMALSFLEVAWVYDVAVLEKLIKYLIINHILQLEKFCFLN